ncbi:MAG: NUDIX domain-containing protein [Flavobacteriales bacterium]|nr:NUDIX domain-containing protein [Flavobacteriales bacterium]MCB9166149.1 NUDIX domain-containing protein [Flavobacteriales bacterium]
MRRKYEVSIDGKPTTITGSPPANGLPEGMLLLHIGTPDELDHALHRITEVPEITGAWIHGERPDVLWEVLKARFRPVAAAGGVIHDEDGRLLAIRRDGKWDLPKGKVDPGESLEDAAVREVREECGLDEVRSIGPLCETWHTYLRKGDHWLKRTTWFRMEAGSASRLLPQAEEGITAVEWLDREGLERFRADTYPTLLTVIAAWEAEVRRSRT